MSCNCSMLNTKAWPESCIVDGVPFWAISIPQAGPGPETVTTTSG